MPKVRLSPSRNKFPITLSSGKMHTMFPAVEIGQKMTVQTDGFGCTHDHWTGDIYCTTCGIKRAQTDGFDEKAAINQALLLSGEFDQIGFAGKLGSYFRNIDAQKLAVNLARWQFDHDQERLALVTKQRDEHNRAAERHCRNWMNMIGERNDVLEKLKIAVETLTEMSKWDQNNYIVASEALAQISGGGG